MLIDGKEFTEAEIKYLLVENAAIKQDIKKLKGAIVTVLVEFGVVNDKLEPQKVNKFKLAKKAGSLILDAMDGAENSFIKNILDTAKPMISKYQDL